MIEFKNITKIFSKKIKAVDDISLKIEDGEIFGFLGPNGAGKSTSLKMLVGILEQSQGTITIDGLDTLKDSIKTKKILSYVPDNPDIYTKMTGIKYLNFISDIYDVDKSIRKERIEKFNNKLELGDAIYDNIEDYSHGMRQKLVLIGALITDPKILILDEPMVGLDVKTSFNLKNILRELANDGKIVVFSSHIMEVVEKICDRIAIINKGKLLFSGTIEELRTKYSNTDNLEKIFLEMTENE